MYIYTPVVMFEVQMGRGKDIRSVWIFRGQGSKVIVVVVEWWWVAGLVWYV